MEESGGRMIRSSSPGLTDRRLWSALMTGPHDTAERVLRLEEEVQKLRREVAEREGLIAIAEAELTQRRRRMDDLFCELERQSQALDALLNSRSWKLTSPLRLAVKAARKFRFFFGPAHRLNEARAPAVPRAADAGESLEQALQNVLARMGGMRYVHRVSDSVNADKLDVKAVAIYYQDFSATSGQSAWSSVAAAAPQYAGQYQPHLPGELGFYNVSAPGVLARQGALARQYGIYGFCFWGMGPAVSQLISNPGIDIKFCVLLPDELDSSLLETVARISRDPRYLRIDGKPVLIVCDEASSLGVKDFKLPGFYLVAARSHSGKHPDPSQVDAVLDFPFVPSIRLEAASEYAPHDVHFRGRIYTYSSLVEACTRREPDFVEFKTVMPGWDDEPRNPGAGCSLAAATPELYAEWLRDACRRTILRRPEERLVFINAWNGWMDGAHLEPDLKFGYAYLHATANVLRYFHRDEDTQKLVGNINAGFKRASDAAIILHCHYEDLLAPIFDEYISQTRDADVFVTVRTDISRAAVEELRLRRRNIRILCNENRGRDVRPFLFALREVRALGYEIACKIHTKKTPNWNHGPGSLWRRNLLEPLLGSSESIARARAIFQREPDVGLLVPAGSITDLSIPHIHVLNVYWLDRLLARMGRADLIGCYAIDFPAGSMYWFRVAALAGLDDVVLKDDAFEPELGQVDGALAHAVERLVALYAQERGYGMKEVSFHRNPR